MANPWEGEDNPSFGALQGCAQYEQADVSASDHTVTIGGGVARMFQTRETGLVAFRTSNGDEAVVHCLAGVQYGGWHITHIRTSGTTVSGGLIDLGA